jgi:hypothetical protein
MIGSPRSKPVRRGQRVIRSGEGGVMRRKGRLRCRKDVPPCSNVRVGQRALKEMTRESTPPCSDVRVGWHASMKREGDQEEGEGNKIKNIGTDLPVRPW